MIISLMIYIVIFTIDRIQAPRMISCNGNERKPVNEILVRNF